MDPWAQDGGNQGYRWGILGHRPGDPVGPGHSSKFLHSEGELLQTSLVYACPCVCVYVRVCVCVFFKFKVF